MRQLTKRTVDREEVNEILRLIQRDLEDIKAQLASLPTYDTTIQNGSVTPLSLSADTLALISSVATAAAVPEAEDQWPHVAICDVSLCDVGLSG